MIKNILLVLAIALSASSVLAQNGNDRPLITVTGQAEIMVVPDEVAFNLRVVTMDKDLLAAQAKNDQTVKAVLALARQYQIPPAQMQTDHITLSERYTDEDVTKEPPCFSVTLSLRELPLCSETSARQNNCLQTFSSQV